MDLEQRDEGGVIRLTIRGELDALTAPTVRERFESLAEKGPEHVVLDLSELTLIDSSGVGAIVSLFKRLRMRGGDLGVTGLTGQPRSIFELLRLDRVFNVA